MNLVPKGRKLDPPEHCVRCGKKRAKQALLGHSGNLHPLCKPCFIWLLAILQPPAAPLPL